MIAVRVTHNGNPVCIAGAEDLAVLNSIVNAIGNLGPRTKSHREEPPDIYLHVGGLTGRVEGGDEHVRWAEQRRLAVGDRVEIAVVEAAQADPPAQSWPVDRERQEQKERERFEYAREVYLSLRHKYEPGQA
jgi:hypothetical protein